MFIAEGGEPPLGSLQQRAVLALLLIHVGGPVSRDRLVDELWGDRPPASADHAVQVYVSGIRKSLRGCGVEVRRTGSGYLLEVDKDRVDACRFERLVEEAQRLLAVDPDRARGFFEQALALWRGPPLGEFAGYEFARREADRLQELQAIALEGVVEARLAAGEHAEVIGQITRLVAANPLRERPRQLLMLALYRSGRHAEALAAYRDAVAALDEIGLQPGPELRALQEAILRHDPSLRARFDGPVDAVAAPTIPISVFLADDNLIAREGVRALLTLEDDIDIVGVAGDYDGLVAGAEAAAPQVIVTDIRMPPNFEREGIDAAHEVRKRHPGTGIVILSQYDDPEYAVSLLGEGAAGYAYLLKDRVAEGDQLARAVREVTSGGSMLDPKIVDALVEPVSSDESLTDAEERLLLQVAQGRTIKALAVSERTTPEAVSSEIEKLFLKLARGVSKGRNDALRRLRMLHQAIADREEQGQQLSRLLPGGLADEVIQRGRRPGESETRVVTVLMSDVRGYSAIAESADPSTLARQLSEHRAEMGDAIIGQGGTVMQFVGDAVMGVFGAPVRRDDHADRALRAALAMHAAQRDLNLRWQQAGVSAFEIGIGMSTGEVAAALLGSEQRLEYSVVGDSVILAQRLQQWASRGETVLSEATFTQISTEFDAERLPPARVGGRQSEVVAYRIPAAADPSSDGHGGGHRVRVMIADDQEVFRLAAREVVESTVGFKVVGEAETGEAAVELATGLGPDLVLMDLMMPGIDGFEATRQILDHAPGRVVILVMSTEEASEYAAQAIDCGAAAFVPKSQLGPEHLADVWAAATAT